MENCTICPRQCGVNRLRGQLGFCRQGAYVKAGRAALHMWEEPCISGRAGSGAVFFSGCSLGCIYCQNHEISHRGSGKEISLEQLSDTFLRLQDEDHANNINLVTAGHFLPQTVEALKMARGRGLHVPVVYNSSGYEKAESLKHLEGLVDIYLPDFKYLSEDLARTYSKAGDYPRWAKETLQEMVRQVGKPRFYPDLSAEQYNDLVCQEEDQDYLGPSMRRGVIVRHLVLPGQVEESKAVISYLHETYGDQIYISIMHQYTPMPHLVRMADSYHLSDQKDSGRDKLLQSLKRRVSDQEYEEVVDYAIDIGVQNAFIQPGDVATESFVPSFRGEGL